MKTTMRQLLYLTLLMLLAALVTNGRHSQSRKKISDDLSRKARLGGPNNNILPYGRIGVPQPGPECTLSWMDFTTHVVGKTWLGVYSIDGHTALFPDKTSNIKVMWKPVGDHQVTRESTFWRDTDSICVNLTGVFECQHPTKVIMTPVDPDGAYSQPNRLDIIVSDNPSKYLLWYICYDTSLNLEDKCTRAFAAILIPDPRQKLDMNMDGIPDDDIDLTNTDWSSIEKMTQRSIGERLVNNDLLGFKWYWKGQKCPFLL